MAPVNPRNDVRIKVAGAELADWIEYQIESDLLNDADAFSFKVANPEGRLSGAVKKFDVVQVLVDGTVQMSGFVDDINLEVTPDGGATLEVVGRDRFGQLVDVSAEPQTLQGLDLGQIAVKLALPFVEEWIFDNERNRERLQRARALVSRLQPLTFREKLTRRRLRLAKTALTPQQIATVSPQEFAPVLEKHNALLRREIESDQRRSAALIRAQANLARLKREIFPRVKVEPGDSPLTVIKKYAERAGFMVWLDAEGRGVIAKPNYDQSPSQRIYLYPPKNPDRRLNNALSASVELSGRDQYAIYRIVGHSANTSESFGVASRQESSVQDSGVPLDRTLIVTGKGNKRRQIKEQVTRDLQQREFNALKLSYTMRGHDQDQKLWQIDTIVSVDDEVTGQRGDFYCSRRRFIGGIEGQKTEIELHPRGVLLP